MMAGLMASRNLLSTIKNSSTRSLLTGNLHKNFGVTSSCASLNRRYVSTEESRMPAQGTASQSQNLAKMISQMEESVRKFGRVNSNSFHDAMRMFTALPDVSAAEAMLLLRCCGELMPHELPSKRRKLADVLWSKIENKQLKLDTSHYNALLKVYLENEHSFSPLEFLSMLHNKGIEPNRVTYQRLVHRYCQEGDIESATKILEHMKEKGLHINEHIFYALMLGYSRAGDLASCSGVLDMMSQSGVDITVDSYLALAVAQAEQGDIDAVKATLNTAEEKDQPTNDQDILDVIFALASKGHTQHVPQMIAMMKKNWGYNQDCKNMIYRLLNKDCDEAAELVYRSMTIISSDADAGHVLNPTGQAVPGAFYIRHLIKLNRPAGKILEFAGSISPRLKTTALMFAVEENSPITFEIMRLLMDQDPQFTVKPHYFWPLFVKSKKFGGKKAVYKIIEEMNSLDVPIVLSTIADYIVPALVKQKVPSSDIVSELDALNVSRFNSVNGLVMHFVNDANLKRAVEIVQEHPVRLVPALHRNLVIAAARTLLFEDTALILGQMTIPRRYNDSTSPTAVVDELDETSDIAGKFLDDFIYRTRGKGALEMMQAMEGLGIGIGTQRLDRIKNGLKENWSDEVDALLQRLSSGELERVELKRTGGLRNRSNDRMTMDDLEKLYERRKGNNQEVDRLEINLLNIYTKTGEVEKAETVFDEINRGEAGRIGIGSMVLMMDMYASSNMLEKATDILTKIRELYPDMSIDKTKLLKLATLMYKQGMTNEVFDLLTKESSKKIPEASSEELEDVDLPTKEFDNVNSHKEALSMNLLGIPASAGDAVGYESLLKVLLEGEYISNSPRSEGKKIELYCSMGDIESAFNLFKEIKDKSNVLVYKHMIIKELIKREDSEKLQEIWKLSSEIHGEANSLLDLSFAFLEQGKLSQAKKLMDTRGLRIRENRVAFWCKNYQEKGDIKVLEDFLSVTGELVSADRRLVCHYLFKCYASENATDKALDLWTKMQEESIPPSNEFLFELGQFLMKNDITPPFEVPAQPTTIRREVSLPPVKVVSKAKGEIVPDHIVSFREMLSDNKFEEAMALYRQSLTDPSKTLYNRDMLDLISKLMEQDRLEDVTALVEENPRFTGRSFDKLVTLSQYLKNLASKGQMDTIKAFMDASPMKEKYVFAMHLSRASVISDRTEECLDLLLSFDDNEETRRVISPPGICNLMSSNPSLVTKISDKLDSVSEDCRSKLKGALWANHFCNREAEKSEQMLQDLISEGGQLPFSSVCLHARQTQDTAFITDCLDIIKKNPVLSNKYCEPALRSCYIDLLLESDQVSKAVDEFKSFIKTRDVTDLYMSTFKQLKQRATENNIPFTYRRERKRASASSSSSSSDSD